MGTESNINDPISDDADLEALVDEATQIDGGTQVEEDQHVSEASAVGNVVSLLPVHAAPNTGKNSLKVSRGPGRPRKVERMPTTSDLEYHAQIVEQKGQFIDKDAVVIAAYKHADPLSMLAVIKTEVAKESAALHFQRIENEKLGKDTSQVSTRRIDALKKIADIELELKKLGADTIDVTSEKMVKVFTFFIGTVRSILEENLTPEQLEVVFNRLETEFVGWQEKLAAQLR
jgi:hypothetical protein